MDGDVEYISAEEACRALTRLGAADAVRLSRLSRIWARGLRRHDADDLLNETFARILAGSRRWPAHVPLATFAEQVMRSVRSQWRHEAAREPLLADAEEAPPEPYASPLDEYDTKDLFERMRAALANDPPALGVLDQALAGSDRDEARAALGMSATEYDTARRRMTRRLADTFEKGWNP